MLIKKRITFVNFFGKLTSQKIVKSSSEQDEKLRLIVRKTRKNASFETF